MWYFHSLQFCGLGVRWFEIVSGNKFVTLGIGGIQGCWKKSERMKLFHDQFHDFFRWTFDASKIMSLLRLIKLKSMKNNKGREGVIKLKKYVDDIYVLGTFIKDVQFLGT